MIHIKSKLYKNMLNKTNAKNISGVRNNWFLFHLKKDVRYTLNVYTLQKSILNCFHAKAKIYKFIK